MVKAFRDHRKHKTFKGKGQGKATADKRLPSVPLYKIFMKAQVRSYAADNGSLLLTGDENPAKYYAPKALREHLTAENSELVNRCPMASIKLQRR